MRIRVLFRELGKIAAGKIAFTTKYGGNTVTGLAGASVNFTWSFSAGVKYAEWGLKDDGGNYIENNGVLVSLDKNGPLPVAVPPAYGGRVSESGDVSSGQVIFTLSQIKRSDERFYACRINPTDGFDQPQFDSVYLAVKGEYLHSQLILFYLQGGGECCTVSVPSITQGSGWR